MSRYVSKLSSFIHSVFPSHSISSFPSPHQLPSRFSPSFPPFLNEILKISNEFIFLGFNFPIHLLIISFFFRYHILSSHLISSHLIFSPLPSFLLFRRFQLFIQKLSPVCLGVVRSQERSPNQPTLPPPHLIEESKLLVFQPSKSANL